MSNRNTNARYDLAPQVHTERSTFPMDCNIKTSWNVGELIPFYVQEILPGDTVKIETAKAVRLQTLITPVMDNLYLDTYYFFVPNRLVWEHWQAFCGENIDSAWAPDVEYTIPIVQTPQNVGWQTGTIADYMGVPTGLFSNYDGINALPFRAYAKIVEDWFRDENLQDHIWFPTDDAAIEGSNGSNYVTDLAKGGKPFIACKYRDYFTSCLPAPQKGEAVKFLPELPVITTNVGHDNSGPALSIRTTNGTVASQLFLGSISGSMVAANATYNDGEVVRTNTVGVHPNNLWVKSNISGTTINDLRQAFQIQRMLELDARGGTRYIELLKAHFGITSPDARLQRSEYLGGNRVPFNIEQVLQTSNTNDVTPQGNTAGWSLTNDDSFDVNKSFVEHGYIIGLVCARYDHSYQQGMEKHWLRRRRYDYYWPALAHLGESAVNWGQICWTGDEAYDTVVFGYQEAWADYRYKPNYITGEMRSSANGTLDAWHFGDFYWDDEQDIPDPPFLSAEWIQEDKSNIDRCLAVTSAVSNQIFGDIMVKCMMTRPMPLYSIPGLVDHF